MMSHTIQKTLLQSLLRYISRGTSPTIHLLLGHSQATCGSSQLYQTFDIILVLAHGQAIYSGPGSFAPVDYFNQQAAIPKYKEGYNVADYLLEVASDPPVSLFQMSGPTQSTVVAGSNNRGEADVAEKGTIQANGLGGSKRDNIQHRSGSSLRGRYAATFLTQLEVLSGREWKILRR